MSDPIHGAHRSWTSADGLTLHARDYAGAAGAARLPVICLHGLTRNSRDFDVLAPWLAAGGRRVLAVDIRGRGLSARDPAADYRLPTYAADIARGMEAMGIARAQFVGTSMGGLITMRLALTHPALVAGAVINDVGPVLAQEGLARIAGYAGKAAAIDGWQGAADYLRAQNDHALPHYRAADWDRMARRMFREAEGRVIADYDPAIANAFADGPADDDPWAAWHALADARPVLLLRGARSDLLGEDIATHMVMGRERVLLRSIPDVGHAPMLDEPIALAAIERFMADNP